MNLLTGNSDLKKLSIEKQEKFELFYQSHVNHKLLPIFADLSLLSIIVGVIFHISSLLQQNDEVIHPLIYVYCGLLFLLGIVHRAPIIRRAAPLMIYMIFLVISLFSYLDFLAAGGGLLPIFGVFFFLSSLGFITASIKHTLIILSTNFILLSAASALIYNADQWFSEILDIVTNWFVLMCMLIAPASALFSRWLYRNLYAMQFLFADRNELLQETFKALKSTEEQLIYQQKHQALNHMAKGLLHEIINPLNSSMQALGYIKSKNNGDPDVIEALDEAIMHQQRIADIVVDLRNYARPEGGLATEPFHLCTLVEKSIKFCHQELTAEGVDVQLHISNKHMIHCHPTSLTQVFVNLLLNACSALNHKSQSLDVNNVMPSTILVSSIKQSDSLKILIKDNGKGIESDDLKRLIEPFYTDNAAPDKLGLGLSICQTIMRHHGGSISIDSAPGEWTEIALIFPFQPSL